MGDEDCLNLNVYAPKIDKKKRAVMVYIHGGAFIMGGGSSFFFGPNYLLEKVNFPLQTLLPYCPAALLPSGPAGPTAQLA